MIKSKPLILALFAFNFFLNFLCPAQNPDSLKKQISSLSGKNKIDAYLKIGNIYLDKFGKPDSLLLYSEMALKKAGELNYAEGKQNAIYNIAIAYQKKNNFDTSIVILNKLFSESKGSSNFNFLGDIEFNLGVNFRRLNDFKTATSNFLKAISNYEKGHNENGIALSYARLAGIFTLQKQFDQALLYGGKAHKAITKDMDPLSKITILSTLSGIYIQVGDKDKRYLDSSIICAKEAMDLTNKFQFYTKGNQLSLSISNAYEKNNDYEKALEYCKVALTYRNYLYPNEILVTYANFGNCYFKLKQYKQALIYLDSVKYILKKYPDPFYEMRAAESEYEYYKASGNPEKALKGLEKFKLIKDSMFNVEKSTVINELEQKYNKAQNEKTITELNQEKEILNQKEEISQLKINALIIGVLFLALLIFAIVFFYRQSVLKSKFKTLEIEQRLNRARINPHFFFNALASLQALSMEEKKSKEISEYIHRFSKIMRESLESTFNELNTIENEIEFLTHYLELQKLRSDNRFTYNFKVDENIETNSLMIPGMILQPFIENSIEHGFSSIETGGKIDISFSLENEQLKVSVIDNGSGFKENEKHKSYPSRATQIIRDRLYLLNKQYKTNAIFELTNLPDNKGTKVEILLPVIPKN